MSDGESGQTEKLRDIKRDRDNHLWLLAAGLFYTVVAVTPLLSNAPAVADLSTLQKVFLKAAVTAEMETRLSDDVLEAISQSTDDKYTLSNGTVINLVDARADATKHAEREKYNAETGRFISNGAFAGAGALLSLYCGGIAARTHVRYRNERKTSPPAASGMTP